MLLRHSLRPVLSSARHRSLSSAPADKLPKRRSLVDITFIAGAGAVVSGFLLYQRANRNRPEEVDSMTDGADPRGVFTVPILSQ